MLLLIYSLTALSLLALVHRFVCPLSRGAAALLFLLPFVFVGGALVRGRVVAPVDKAYLTEPLSVVKAQYGIEGDHNPASTDVFAQLIPWRQAVRESYARGEWPLWNPYILCGDILAAAAQPAVYSPFTLVALLLPAAVSFTFTAAITFLVAGIGAFTFARELGCSEGSASVAAAGWAYSAPMALYVPWPLGFSWALLPLVLLATRRVMKTPSLRSGVLLTFTLVLLILAGHPQTALHVVLIGAVYGLVESRKPRAIGTAAAAGILALLVCAIYLLPFLEAIPQAAEWELRQMRRPSDTSAQVLVSLATDVFPFLHLRKWESVPGLKAETSAVGSIILALAIYAVWRIRNRTTWLFAALALFCLAAHAAWGPVAWMLDILPAINERLAFAAAFFLVMLAALGAEQLGRGAAITMLVVLIALGAGTYAIAHSFEIAPAPAAWGHYRIFAELALLAAAALLINTRIAIPALVALLFLQRALTDGGIHRSFPTDAAYPRMEIVDKAKASEPFRIVGQSWALIPGTSTLYGLEDARGYEAMTFKRLFATYPLWSTHQPVFFNRVDDLSRPFLSMINVRFAFTKEGEPVPPGWRVTASQQNAVLLENANVLPRAFVPRTVRLGWQNEIVLAQMSDATDFRDLAWIDADVVPTERANGSGTLQPLRRARQGYTFDADMEHDAWIVITNSAWKGWRAYIDNRRVRLNIANAAFLGLHIARGRHHIRLIYWPESFVTGRAISLVTLLGIAAIWAWTTIRGVCERRSRSSSSF